MHAKIAPRGNHTHPKGHVEYHQPPLGHHQPSAAGPATFKHSLTSHPWRRAPRLLQTLYTHAAHAKSTNKQTPSLLQINSLLTTRTSTTPMKNYEDLSSRCHHSRRTRKRPAMNQGNQQWRQKCAGSHRIRVPG